MNPLPPPPKVNPSALALGAAAAEQLRAPTLQADADGIVRPPLDRRDVKVPVGMKKVYRQGAPHQGAKEMARRARQLARGKK